MKRIVVAVMALGLLACGGAVTPEGSDPTFAGGPVASGGGAFAATPTGVCELQASCGCVEESRLECVNGVKDLPLEVLGCIVAQDCASICAGGGVRCVEQWAARESAASRQDHEMQMDLINNRPTGGVCPRGKTEVRDTYGDFVRCE